MPHESKSGHEPQMPEKPKRRRGLGFSEIEATGESIVYDPEKDKATVLSPVGAVVWLLCDGQQTVDAICRELSGHFGDVDEDVVRSDVEAAIADFAAEGLLDS